MVLCRPSIKTVVGGREEGGAGGGGGGRGGLVGVLVFFFGGAGGGGGGAGVEDDRSVGTVEDFPSVRARSTHDEDSADSLQTQTDGQFIRVNPNANRRFAQHGNPPARPRRLRDRRGDKVVGQSGSISGSGNVSEAKAKRQDLKSDRVDLMVGRRARQTFGNLPPAAFIAVLHVLGAAFECGSNRTAPVMMVVHETSSTDDSSTRSPKCQRASAERCVATDDAHRLGARNRGGLRRSVSSEIDLR